MTLAQLAEALPGAGGKGITTAEIIAITCAVVVLIVIAVWVRWRR